MRRIILVLAAIAAAISMVGGIALAATIDGTGSADTLTGTGEADTIRGYGGGDTIYDGPEDDAVVDNIYGGSGDDTIVSTNVPASRDVVSCGGDRDMVTADGLDDVSANCEDVDRLSSAKETRRSMAQDYAAEYGVSAKEAARRLSLQDDAGELEAELEDDEAATFGDLYIEHEPTFRVVALFTRGGEQTIRPYVAGTPLESVVEVRQVDATLEKLEAAQAEATSIYESRGVPFNSDIDVIQNRAEIYVPEETGTRVQSTQLPDQVAEVPVDTLSTFEDFMYGGRALSTCTSGFTVRHDSGTEGFLTAGHCRPNPEDGGQYFQGTLMPFQQQDLQGSQDVQWHTSPDIDDRAYFRSGSNTLTPVRRLDGRSRQSVGRFVCKYGMSTQRTCGRIAGKSFDPGADFNATFIRVKKEGVNLSSSGDSGSPWFDGRTALGIHSGSYGADNLQAFYMAINYAQDTYLGIKVQRVR